MTILRCIASRTAKLAAVATVRLVVALAPLAIGGASYSQEPAATADAGSSALSDKQSIEIEVPLLERAPFDRITLDSANQNVVIETVLIEFPNRQVPNPRPSSGSLEIRRLSHPSVPYTVQWSAIEKVELYEQMLLVEAEQLTAAGKFAEAFDDLAFLTANYPQLPGLEQALQAHLWREASASYAGEKLEEAWPALHALYQRNPRYPRLVNAVQAVSDDLIGRQLKEQDYSAARVMLDSLEKNFPDLGLTNVIRWRQQFEQEAAAQLDRARQALADEDYGAARDAVAHARSIMPTVPGSVELWKQIQEAAPEIRVGVTQTADASVMSRTPAWATARLSDLVNPRLVEMVGFGAEGGIYASRWSELTAKPDGLATTISLSPQAMQRGIRPEALSLQLAEMADPQSDRLQVDFAALAVGVELLRGRNVQIDWRRPHVRPEAFLQIPLRWLATSRQGPGLWFDPLPAERKGVERPYQRTGPPEAAPGEPRLIVELTFNDDEAAFNALMRGDVDAIDRVPPWQLARMEQTSDVIVGTYRLPTVHVLIPNPTSPLLEFREFRRALNYGIDSESIVRDILLGGQQQNGFRTISGPFPAGVTLNDPVGYAYNTELSPRPYEPRLAALLAGVARTALAKREAALKKSTAAGSSAGEKPSAASDKLNQEGAETEETAEQKLPPPAPLILAHGTDPLARLACQSIKIQLDQIGIPVKLAEFGGDAPPLDLAYDLLYAELAVWEPIYDARRLLGSTGVAGRASALMAAALDQLDQAENWNQARAQLKNIHRIAYYDLPLIPLWQTVNHFAHRRSLAGVGQRPVSLYQNVSSWQKSFE